MANSFREKVEVVLTSRFFIFETILITSFVMWWFGGLGFVAGLVIALITLWASKWDWSYFGLGSIKWLNAFVCALAFTIIIILLVDFLLEPTIETITSQVVNLEQFDGLRGNFLNLIARLAIVWVFIAFGEEFFYRGYLMNRLAHLLGNNNTAWVIAAIFSSTIFGLAHEYQGISGMITAGSVGLILAVAFLRNRNNLLIVILTHGIYDTYGLTMIYLNKETLIKDWVIETTQQLLK